MSTTDDRIRVAVAGIGGRGTWAAQQLAQHPAYRLTALCDVNLGKLDHFRRKAALEHVPAAPSIEACLRDFELDAVVVTVHDAAHANVAIPALEAGKFVFVEKPLEATAARCRAIVEADRAAGGKTFVGMNLRFAPLYATAKRLVDQGAVGQVLTIQADEFYDGGRSYFRRWNRLRAFGGGLWITKACHDFDLLYWLAGQMPRAVYAIDALTCYRPRADAPLYCADCERKETCFDSFYHGRREPEEKSLAEVAAEHGDPRPDLCLFNADKDTFDHGIATVDFEGGILGTYTCNVVAGFTDRRLRVSGTRGTLDGSLASETVLLRQRDPRSSEEVSLDTAAGGHGGGDSLLFEEFADFVRGTREPRVRPPEAMVAVLMGLAATRSADERRRVEMSELEATHTRRRRPCPSPPSRRSSTPSETSRKPRKTSRRR